MRRKLQPIVGSTRKILNRELAQPSIEPRTAMSLIELLIVIAIMGVLIGLTVAAVQRVRASAARAHCLENLRQIGLALHQYHESYGSFPPGVSYQDRKHPQPYMNWHTRLLPYLEQDALWQQALAAFRKDHTFLNNPPHAGLGTPMPVFVCPVDSRTRTAHVFSNGVAIALTSYLGSEGTNSFHQDGVLFVDSAIRLSDITDGTSQTLMVGERPPSANLQLGWWYAGMGLDTDGEGDSVLGVRTKNGGKYFHVCPVGPYHFGPGDVKNQCDAFHFWSLHSGGAHFLFADGSVRFVKYSADSIMPQLATRAGGEAVELPD